MTGEPALLDWLDQQAQEVTRTLFPPAPLPVGPLASEQREELDGLAEPHVVGEAGAEPQTVEEGEPAESPLLVRAEGRLESRRRRGGRDAPLSGFVEELAEPA